MPVLANSTGRRFFGIYLLDVSFGISLDAYLPPLLLEDFNSSLCVRLDAIQELVTFLVGVRFCVPVAPQRLSSADRVKHRVLPSAVSRGR
jgi:hypothetical protein